MRRKCKDKHNSEHRVLFDFAFVANPLALEIARTRAWHAVPLQPDKRTAQFASQAEACATETAAALVTETDLCMNWREAQSLPSPHQL
jgi:hypothetical protein